LVRDYTAKWGQLSEDGPLKTRIETMVARCGVTNIPVLVGSNSTGVDGLGPTNRIYLQTNLASVESPDQIEFTIGHELKHYVMGDNWKALAIIAAFMLAGFCLTDRLGRAAIRRFSPRWGFSELSDPASLPLIVFLLTFFWLAISPFFNMFSRHISCARLGYFLSDLPGRPSLHSRTHRIR
jgi:STE24 endopeptidase